MPATKKYSVLIEVAVGVRFHDIEAESQQAAIDKAEELAHFDALFNETHGWGPIKHTQYQDHVSAYLVDEVGDEEFENSRWYDSDRQPLRAEEL